MKNNYPNWKTKLWAILLTALAIGFSANATVWNIPNGNADTLEHFIENTALWNAGDTIMLTDAGPYIVNGVVDIHKTITVLGDPGLPKRPEVHFYNNGFQVLDSMVSVTIKDLRCSGYNADSTNRAPFLLQYRKNKAYMTYYNTVIDNVEAWGFRGGIDLDNAKHCYYDTIIVNNCLWSDFSADFAIDPNINFSKYVRVTNSTFYKMGLGFIKNPDYYKVDPAWDTIIPKKFVIDHNTFYKVGGGNGGIIQMNDAADQTITLTFTNNIVYRLFDPANSRPFNINKLAGSFTLNYNLVDSFEATAPTKMKFNLDSVKLYDNVTVENLYEYYPEFKDTGKFNFTLPFNSPLMKASSSGGPIGDPRWALAEEPFVPGPNCHLIPNTSADTLEHFIENLALWNSGDTIMLTDAGPYIVNNVIDVHRTITVMGDPNLLTRPEVHFYSNGFQVLDSMISVTIKDLRCSGYNVDSTNRAPFLLQYRKNKMYMTYYNTVIDNVEAWGFRGGIDLDNAKHCYYDTIIVNNCLWSDFSADFAIDPNINFSKYVKVTNSTFYKMALGFIKNPDYYKVDPAWDTIIPKKFVIDHNTFYKVGGGNGGIIQMNDAADQSITLTFTNNIVYRLFDPANCRPFNINKLAGSFTLNYNLVDSFEATALAKMKFNLDSVKLYDNVSVENLYEYYPEFKDTGKFDFTLPLTSPLLGASSSGGPIGDPRWAPNASIDVVAINAVLTRVVEGVDVQLEAVVTLEGSLDKTVTWSVENAYGGTTGTATIDAATGLLSPTAAGKVKVKAASNYNSAFSDTLIVTIEPKIAVTAITLAATNAQGNPATEITNKGGFLNIAATIVPGNADDRSITWSLAGDGKATITAKTPTTAELVAVQCGDVIVRATANDGSGIMGELTIPISGQTPVTAVAVAGTGGATAIAVNAGTLQMIATVTPDTACVKEVTWSVDKPEIATISATGLLTALTNGTVTVTARANDGSYKSGTATITVSNQGDGVNDVSADAVQMVPNPAQDFIMIKSPQRAQVTISNITGAVVLITEVDPNVAIQVSHLKAGLYIVNVKSGNQDKMFRLVKE